MPQYQCWKKGWNEDAPETVEAADLQAAAELYAESLWPQIDSPSSITVHVKRIATEKVAASPETICDVVVEMTPVFKAKRRS